MTKTRFISSVVLAMLAATQSGAQSLPGIAHEGSTITLAFNFHNNASDDPYLENYTTQFSAASAYSFGGGFGATFTLGYNKEQYTDSFYSERYLLDLNPTYNVGMGTIGAYYTAISYNDGDTEDHAAYGVTADLQSGAFGLEAYAGVYEEEGDFSQDNYGLAASYDVSGAATVYAAYRRDSFGGGDFYNASNAIGATYSLADATGVPVNLTGEASIFTASDISLAESEWYQFSVMASYDFGGGAGSIFRGFRAWDYYYD